MANSPRIEELEKKFSENARRYFAPLANEYRKAGDLDRAIEICRAHLPQQPGHMSGHVVYGQALYESRQLEEAKTVFESALALDPENLIALRHLGDIARDSGDPATARSWYLRVLDADPRNDEVAGMLAELDAAAPAAAQPEPAASGAAGWGDINPERSGKEGSPSPDAGATAPEGTVDAAANSEAVDETVEADAPAASATSEQEAATPEEERAAPADEERSAPAEPVESPEAALFAPDASPPAASLDQVLNEAFAAEADTLEIEQYSPERAPAESGSAKSGSAKASPAQPQEDDESFAEVDALFDEIAPPRQTGSQRAVTGAQPRQPEPAAPAKAGKDTGDTMFGDDATPDSVADAGAVSGLETAEFISPSRATTPSAPRRDTGSMAVTGLTSFDQPTDEDSSTRAAFVTETMAELYLQQGFVAEALDIYRQLLAQNPDDASLRDRVEQLESGGRSSMSVAAVSSEVIEAAKQRHSTRAVRTVRSFFGLLAGRRAPHHAGSGERTNGDDSGTSHDAEPEVSFDEAEPEPAEAPPRLDMVGELFGDAGVPEEDEQAAARLSAGFAAEMFTDDDFARPEAARAAPEAPVTPPAPTGRSARQGAGELSLDQVFREPAPRNPRKSGAYSFDQFFSDGTPTSAASDPSPDASGDDESQAPEGDLEQFTAWLEGLKRK